MAENIKTELKSKVIFVMGVSGSGKSSIGKLIAKEMDLVFIEGDDHHPPVNIKKMSLEIPLTDDDRAPWLDRLHEIATEHLSSGCVIACSALRKIYRDRLSNNIKKDVRWIYLKGNYDQIFERMKKRKGHFMNPVMLKSQFEVLEEPDDAIEMNIADTPEVIVNKLKSILK